MTNSTAALIIRTAHKKNYSIIDNVALDDSRLHPTALGILVKLLRKPDNWKVIPQALAKETGLCVDTVRKYLQQLADCGYLVYEKITNSIGRFNGWVYTVFEGGTGHQRKPPLEPTLPKQEIFRPENFVPKNFRPIINTEVNKNLTNQLIPSPPSDYIPCDNACGDPWDEDEDGGILSFSVSEPDNKHPVTFGKFIPLAPETRKIDLYSVFQAPSAIGTALVSGVGESSAADYIITTNDNQTTQTTEPVVELIGVKEPPVPKLTYADRKAARQKATLEAQGKEKGLWQSMAELNAFIAALTAHTVENTRIHSPKSWVLSAAVAQDGPQKLPVIKLNAGMHVLRVEVAQTPQEHGM